MEPWLRQITKRLGIVYGLSTWGWERGNVLARRVSSRPMDAHFWKKYKENSKWRKKENSLITLWENMHSGRPVFNVWLKARRGVLNIILSYIQEALLPKIQLLQQNTTNQSHKWPENTNNALITNKICQMIITWFYRYMYFTLFCDIVFRMYLVYFKIWCSDQILLVLCPGNMSEDVIKWVRNHSSHIWVWPHSYNLQ